MARGKSVGTAYLTILASTKGLASGVRSALRDAGVSGGQRVAKTLQTSVAGIAPQIRHVVAQSGVAASEAVQSVPNKLAAQDWSGTTAKIGEEAGKGIVPKVVGALKFAGKAGGVLMAAGLALEAKQAIESGFSRAKTLETAGLRLEALKVPADERARILASAQASVKGTAFSTPDAAQLAGNLSAAGVKGKDLDKTLAAVVDTASVAGRDLASMGLIFSSVFARGKLQGDDMMQLLSAGVPVLQLLSKSMGKPAAEISKLVQSGKVTPADLIAALEQGFSGAGKTMAKGYEGASANLEAAKARLGQAFVTPFLPLLTAGATKLTGFLDSAAPYIAKFGESLASLWEGFKDGAAAAVGVVGDWLGKGWDAAVAGWEAVKGAAAAAGPAISAVKGTAEGLWDVMGRPLWDAASATVSSAAIASWEALKTAADALWNTAKGLAQPIMDAASAVGSQVWAAAVAVWDQLKAAWDAVSPLIGFVAQGLWDAAKALGDGVWSVAAGLWSGMASALSGLWDGLKNVVSALGESVWSTVKGLWEGMATALAGLVEGVKAGWPGIQALLGGVMKLLEGLWPILKPIAYLIGGVLYVALVGLAQAIGGILSLAGPILSLAGEVIGGVLYYALTAVSTVLGGLLSLAGPLLGFVGTLVGGVFQVLGAAAGAASTVVGALAHAVGTVLVGAWNGLKTAYDAVVTPIWNAIKAAYETLVKPAMDGIISMFSAVKNAWDGFTGLVDSALKLGSDIIEGLKKGITDAAGAVFNAVKDTVMAPVNWIKEKLGIRSPSRYMMELGGYTGEGFAIGIARSVGGVGEAADSLAAAAIPDVALPNQYPSVPVGSGAAGDIGGPQIVINIAEANMRSEEDIRELARQIADSYNTHLRGRGL